LTMPGQWPYHSLQTLEDHPKSFQELATGMKKLEALEQARYEVERLSWIFHLQQVDLFWRQQLLLHWLQPLQQGQPAGSPRYVLMTMKRKIQFSRLMIVMTGCFPTWHCAGCWLRQSHQVSNPLTSCLRARWHLGSLLHPDGAYLFLQLPSDEH